MENSLEFGSRREKLSFYKYAAKITAPIALQNFMDAAVSSADVIMLSFVSQQALSASALAGQVQFVMAMLLYGVSSGASVLAAQYWGKGDKNAVEKTLGIALRFAFLIGLVFSLSALLAPAGIMSIFTNDPELIEAGVHYLRAVAPSYLLGSIATIYLGVQRSVERVRMSATVHIGAVFMNVILNACFIFGIGPFPKLGIVGVAIATSVTRAVEASVCLVDGLTNGVIRLRLTNILRRGGELQRDFLRFGMPAAANDILWGLAFSVYSVIFGHLSSDIVAANSVATVVRNFGTVVCFGVSNSAGIILGKTMGDNRLKEAKVYASRFAWLSLWTALAGGVVIVLCRSFVLRFMGVYVSVTDTVTAEVRIMLLINAYYIIGQSVNTMLICGIFRAGGDTKFGLICDLIAMWVYAVPVGLIAAFVLKLPEMWVYFILCLDEFVKMPVIILHYKRGKWLNNITR